MHGTLTRPETLGAFRRLIDAMDRGVVAIDGHGRIWHANHSADRILNREVQGLPSPLKPPVTVCMAMKKRG